MRSILSRYRVGSVPYLNALPLTAGLEREIQFLPPTQLARGLEENRLDAALVSSTEVLFSPGLRALDGFGIVSRGPVFSVFLAHRTPLERLRVVHLDPASSTSANLLRVLLAERGIHPEFRPLLRYEEDSRLDDVLLIGNPAIAFRRRQPDHAIWDLGEAWHQLTGLPFVYAVWAIRDDVDSTGLARVLTLTAEAGLARLPELIAASEEFDSEFRRSYLGGHVQYRLDAQAKEGLARFAHLLPRHSDRVVHPLRWVTAEATEWSRV